MIKIWLHCHSAGNNSELTKSSCSNHSLKKKLVLGTFLMVSPTRGAVIAHRVVPTQSFSYEGCNPRVLAAKVFGVSLVEQRCFIDKTEVFVLL